MKKIVLVALILITLFSCKKKEQKDNSDQYPNPLPTPAQILYPRPWSTAFISYKNIANPCGSHSSGYNLFYKDTLLRSECAQYASINLAYPYYINDSIMHFFKRDHYHGEVLSTFNGGYSWKSTNVGPTGFVKFHFINTELIYCVTTSSSNYYFSGIGKSNLSIFKTSFTKGKHYLSDTGTTVTQLDSTLITINDSLSFVVLFN